MNKLTAPVLLLAMLAGGSVCRAQFAEGRLGFALPGHPGTLSIARGDWKTTELSAKPNGREWGVRAEQGDLHFLGFLFAWPENAPLKAEKCRDEMLKAEGPAAVAAVQARATVHSASGVEIATALMVPGNGKFSTLRAFVASGDLCGDLSFTLAKPMTSETIPIEKVKGFLSTLEFDPQAKPTFIGAFAYATLEYNRHQLEGAVRDYKAALALVDGSDAPVKWRRVTTDQLSMAQGMSGDLKGSRATNEAAIVRDPDYPLYYFNLACADAEGGDAQAAQQHLQQAFDRRANMLKGETFPDPAKDDSLQKLKGNQAFWDFVLGISKQLKS